MGSYFRRGSTLKGGLTFETIQYYYFISWCRTELGRVPGESCKPFLVSENDGFSLTQLAQFDLDLKLSHT